MDVIEGDTPSFQWKTYIESFRRNFGYLTLTSTILQFGLLIITQSLPYSVNLFNYSPGKPLSSLCMFVGESLFTTPSYPMWTYNVSINIIIRLTLGSLSLKKTSVHFIM